MPCCAYIDWVCDIISSSSSIVAADDGKSLHRIGRTDGQTNGQQRAHSETKQEPEPEQGLGEGFKLLGLNERT